MNDLLQLKKPLNNVKLSVGQSVDFGTTKKATNHHKRPSISHEISSKRAKNQDATIKQTPQLLHQLITTTTTTTNGVNNSNKARPKTTQSPSIKSEVTANRYAPVTTMQQQSQPTTSTNSVLMNLLVSGCDVSAGYTCLPRPKVAKA
jgi:hypothetical protein